MDRLAQFWDLCTTQQDFGWFCVTLAWAGVVSLLIWTGLGKERERVACGRRVVWLSIALAGAGVGIAELVLHAVPPNTIDAEMVVRDALLSLLLLTQAAAPLSQVTARPRWVLLLLGGAMVLVWAGRVGAPLEANAVLGGLGLAVFVLARRRDLPKGQAWRWHLVVILAVGAQVVSTTGALAEATAQQRRWVELSRWALPSALWQLALAGAMARAVWVEINEQANESVRARWRVELRWLWRVMAVWLVAGLVLALVTGRMARGSFEQSMMARVRLSAEMLDRDALARVVSPAFKWHWVEPNEQPNGRTNQYGIAPFLLKAGRTTRNDLARMERANPDIYWAHFMTIRGGWLTSAVFSSRMPTRQDAVTPHRVATVQDRVDWALQTERWTDPFVINWGELVRARVPIVLPNLGMVGWLAFDTGASRWAAAQALARLQTFGLTGLGAMLILLVALQRLRGWERRRAELEAASARAGDRAKTAFLAKVSHELRTPVQSILGYGEMLDTVAQDAQSRRWTGAIRGQSQLLIRLVNDLIDLSALQAGAFRLSPRVERLEPMIRTVVDSLQLRARVKGLRLELEAGPDIPGWMRFDPDRLRQVMLNLISNALKFTDRGSVTVRMTAKLIGRQSDGVGRVAVCITVIDTGMGISLDDQERLFRPFVRLDQSAATDGAGLGLALSRAICESMGGSLTVESDGVSGSTFRIALELDAAEMPKESPSAPIQTDLKGLRVLVADDNALVRELFVANLRAAGAWCSMASDGLEAVELCESQKFDVVVVDVSMPWLDGFEVARRLREREVTTPRIVGVSADATAAGPQAVEAGVMDVFLIKPLSSASLVRAVRGREGNEPAWTFAGKPAAGDLELIRRLRRMFEEDVERHLAEIAEALRAGDRGWLRGRVHYLKNSADVVGHLELSSLCLRAEAVLSTTDGDHGAVLAELRRVLAASRSRDGER